jgi:hypothetical protein
MVSILFHALVHSPDLVQDHDAMRHGHCLSARRNETFMADNLKQTGKPDDQRINVDQDHELTYWSEKLGVSRDKLREAVAKAGPMVKNVERELRG